MNHLLPPGIADEFPSVKVSHMLEDAADRACQGQVHFSVQDGLSTVHCRQISKRLLVRGKALGLPFEDLSAVASFL